MDIVRGLVFASVCFVQTLNSSLRSGSIQRFLLAVDGGPGDLGSVMDMG